VHWFSGQIICEVPHFDIFHKIVGDTKEKSNHLPQIMAAKSYNVNSDFSKM